MKLASLPMYDRPELREAQDAFWAAIHQILEKNGIESPAQLDRNGFGIDFWKNKDLVLSQTCGLPYRKYLHNKVGLVATPNFEVEGCPPGYYRSCFVVRKSDDERDVTKYLSKTFAYNEMDSQSGFAAAWNHLEPHNHWFSDFIETGTHLESARSVATKRADIASIDAVTWRLVKKYEDFADELTVIEKTLPTPGLPYITSLGNDPKVLNAAIINAVFGLSQDALGVLGIHSVVSIPKATYLRITLPPSGLTAAKPR